MKNLLFITIILAILSSNFTFAISDKDGKTPDERTTLKKGKKFSDKKGNFRIQFPGEPTKDKQVIDTKIGKIDMFTFMYTGDADVYMVAYSDYPKDKIAGAGVESMVQGAKEGFLGNMSLNIIDENEFKMNGNYGVYVEASNDKYYTVVKLFMVDNRLYQLAILSASKNIPKKTSSKFLDSFELTKKK